MGKTDLAAAAPEAAMVGLREVVETLAMAGKPAAVASAGVALEEVSSSELEASRFAAARSREPRMAAMREMEPTAARGVTVATLMTAPHPRCTRTEAEEVAAASEIQTEKAATVAMVAMAGRAETPAMPAVAAAAAWAGTPLREASLSRVVQRS